MPFPVCFLTKRCAEMSFETGENDFFSAKINEDREYFCVDDSHTLIEN